MNLDQFISKYTGILCGDTTENFGQCVGLISLWQDNLGLNNPHEYGNAKDLLTNANTANFTVIQNAATNFPVAGDIIVWGSTWGNGYGHTGVVVKADANTFSAFEQNNPGAPHIVSHPNYSGVLGWLHPKVTLPAGGSSDDINRAIDRIKWTQANHDVLKLTGAQTDNYDDTVHNLVDTLDARNKDTDSLRTQVAQAQGQLGEAQTQVNVLQGQINDLNKKVGDLNGANAKLTQNVSEVSKQNSDLLIEIADAKTQLAAQPKADSSAIEQAVEEAKVAEAKSNTLQGQLNALYVKLGVDSQDNALSTIDTLKKPLVEQIKPVIKQHEKLFTQLANLSKQLSKTKIKPGTIEKVMGYVKGFVSKIMTKGGK